MAMDPAVPEKVMLDFQRQVQASDTHVMTGRALQPLPDGLEGLSESCLWLRPAPLCFANAFLPGQPS